MNKYCKFILMATLIAGGAPLFTSCDNDAWDVEGRDAGEWSANYVYIQRQDYLSGDVKTFVLDHDIDGVISGDDVQMTFNVKTQKPAPADITVKLDLTCDESFDASLIHMTATTAKIPQGETQSEDIVVSVASESLAQIDNKFEAGFQVSISEMSANGGNAHISENLNTIKAKIRKTARCKLLSGAPENCASMNGLTDWTFKIMDGVENSGSNTVAGTGGGDLATNGKPFWITVDMKKEQKVFGINTKFWGSSYAARRVEIYTSADGRTWESLGELATSGTPQDITFVKPITTRYLKYELLNVPGRVSLTRFNVYVPIRLGWSEALPAGWTELDRTGWTVSCNTPPYDGNYSLEGMLDNNHNTGYFTYIGSASPIDVTMTEPHRLKGISITADAHYYGPNYSLREVQVKTSEDGTTWEDFMSVGLQQATDGVTPQYVVFDKAVSAKYVKVVPLSDYAGFFGISEIRFYE